MFFNKKTSGSYSLIDKLIIFLNYLIYQYLSLLYAAMIKALCLKPIYSKVMNNQFITHLKYQLVYDFAFVFKGKYNKYSRSLYIC